MSNLGDAVAGPQPTLTERKALFAEKDRLLRAFSKLKDIPVYDDHYEIKYDQANSEWGT